MNDIIFPSPDFSTTFIETEFPTFYAFDSLSNDVSNQKSNNNLHQKDHNETFNDISTPIHRPSCTTPSTIYHNMNNIPFVRIHTHPSEIEISKSKKFNRPNPKHEIKSEPIKSENSDILVRQLSNESNRASVTTQNDIENNNQTDSIIEDSSNTLPVLQRCNECAFISFNDALLEAHKSTHSNNNETDNFNASNNLSHRILITCPGCENKFYSFVSLETHFREDHLMHEQELLMLLQCVRSSMRNKPTSSKVNAIESHNSTVQQNTENQQHKSKIFIRNVDCLREPATIQNEHQMQSFQLDYDNGILPTDDNNDFIDLLDGISIEENSNDNNYNKKSIIDENFTNHATQFETTHDFLDLLSTYDNGNNIETKQSEIETINLVDTVETPRQPKIYIKNVDILKQPIPLTTTNHSNLRISNNASDFEYIPHILQMPGPDNNSYILNNSTSNEIHNMSYQNYANDGFATNTHYIESPDVVPFSSNTPIMTEPTPPPLPAKMQNFNLYDSNNTFNSTILTTLPNPKQKIFIKNVDILKEPQFKEQRGTLHLRTVDEVNLLNTNEVQNLLPPAMNTDELNNPFGVIDINTPESYENATPSVETINSSSNAWTEEFVEMEDDFDCMITDNIENSTNLPSVNLSTPVQNLETPHTSMITIRDIQELTTIPPMNYQNHVIGNASINGIIEHQQKRTNILNENISTTVSTKRTIDDVPPLAPVSFNSVVATSRVLLNSDNLTQRGPPLPPLVPVSSSYSRCLKSISKQVTTSAVGVSVRGRPIGSNLTDISTKEIILGKANEEIVRLKCSIKGCLFRFKKQSTLEYHSRCHDNSASNGPNAMLCPECKSKNYNNWNTLHTHLWRDHSVDMELYSCDLCPFKTPILSRLVNTHMKIHSDDRNFKCNQCDKAFKNAKQLKNHRRWHRQQATNVLKNSNTNHNTNANRNGHSQQCDICGRVVASKSSLKLHALTHEKEKRFKCDSCDYSCNDHNAFRRHKMKHNDKKMYTCPYCDYESIQSSPYQKHIELKHPEVANAILHKCNAINCSFTTVNGTLFQLHMAKHMPQSHIENI